MSREINELHHHGMIASYQLMRQGLGYIGLGLPVLLFFGGMATGQGVEASISHYYYTPFADVFVGALCAIGLFLIGSYGPDSVSFGILSHRKITRIGGLGAIGLALVPTHTDKLFDCSFAQCALGMKLGSDIHHVFAGLFFVSMAITCLLLFAEPENGEQDRERRLQRNRLYHGSGLIILLAMSALYTYRISPDHVKATMDQNSYQFWIESLAVWLFGFCWLVKGGAVSMLRDREVGTFAVNLDCAPTRPKLFLAYARNVSPLSQPIPIGPTLSDLRQSARHGSRGAL
ncbi:MAG: DUF998 domain-containing protein [Pseudoruegeria sp.]